MRETSMGCKQVGGRQAWNVAFGRQGQRRAQVESSTRCQTSTACVASVCMVWCGCVGMPARNDGGEVEAGCLGPWAGGKTRVEEIEQDGEMAPDVARFVVDLEHGAQALQRCARATQSLPGRRQRHSDDRHADKENGMHINTCDGERPMR